MSGSQVAVAVLACLGGLAPGGPLALCWEGTDSSLVGQRAEGTEGEGRAIAASQTSLASTERALGPRGLCGRPSSADGLRSPLVARCPGCHSPSPHGLRWPVVLVTDGSENASRSRSASGKRPARLCPGTGAAGRAPWPPARPAAWPVSRPQGQSRMLVAFLIAPTCHSRDRSADGWAGWKWGFVGRKLRSSGTIPVRRRPLPWAAWPH